MTLAIVPFHLRSGAEAGGVLLDQDGWLSAVETLRAQYGSRINWPALLVEAERAEPRDAAAIARIRQIIGGA